MIITMKLKSVRKGDVMKGKKGMKIENEPSNTHIQNDDGEMGREYNSLSYLSSSTSASPIHVVRDGEEANYFNEWTIRMVLLLGREKMFM